MSGSVTTDGSGHFRFNLENTHASYLLRVVHEHVNYHRMAQAGLKPVGVKVYDAAEKLDRVTAIMEVERLEATGETLEIKQLVTVRNDSRPPRTLMKDRAFEIQVPPEAQVKSGLVQVEDGQPLTQEPIAGEPKGQYYFTSPIRPGDTRFAIVYQLPYNGKALIEPAIRNPLERFVVMLPKSMTFEPKATGIFLEVHGVQDFGDRCVGGTPGPSPTGSGQSGGGAEGPARWWFEPAHRRARPAAGVSLADSRWTRSAARGWRGVREPENQAAASQRVPFARAAAKRTGKAANSQPEART